MNDDALSPREALLRRIEEYSDPHELLEVSPDATKAELLSAYFACIRHTPITHEPWNQHFIRMAYSSLLEERDHE